VIVCAPKPSTQLPTINYYEYKHIVGFEETNLVGNVYYTNHLAWQGRCREMFLRENAPDLIPELSRGLSLATVRCSCEYFAELAAFDEIFVRMRLLELVQNRIDLAFEYFRLRDGQEQLVARGQQQVACMKREGPHLVPAPIPPSLREALVAYGESKV
jgi:enediyne biosynthesis thioesterase